MKIFNKTAITLALAISASTSVYANDMQLDLVSFGGNTLDSGRFIGAADADSATSTFSEFGYSQILATSVYDITDGSIFGSFYDTNVASELTALGIPGTFDAMDGTVNGVVLATPNCAGGQCDIDALSPLVPPLGSDNEGFLQTWDLQVEYHFDGTLTATGPQYTGGYLNIYFNDFGVPGLHDTLAFSANLTGSAIDAANLNLYFDIATAVDGFLNIWNGSSWVDAHDALAAGGTPTLVLDTNVNPPIPTLASLANINDEYAVRQSTLDGSITAEIPEPASIALFGLGLLGFGAASRKRKAQA